MLSTLCFGAAPSPSVEFVTPRPGPYSPRYALDQTPVLSARANALAFTETPPAVNVRRLPAVPEVAVLPVNVKVAGTHGVCCGTKPKSIVRSIELLVGSVTAAGLPLLSTAG